MKLKTLTYNQLQTLCWTEDNRLQAVKDNHMGAYYNYDASGERNLKLTGAVVHMSQNGVPYDYVMLESPTLYASGLITINERGYTKHYFEENKRVCSNIGGGFRDAGYDIMEPIELITPFEDQWTNAKEGIFNTFDECIKSKLDLEKSSEKIVQVMKDHEKDRNEEEYQFYYTNDHLGSSTYITNKEGQITQTLAYLPYGELRSNREYLNINNKYHEQHWVDLDNQPPYITPYKFNGKEKDPETGYNYYGARYLNTDLSIWLSVDPMSDKYPHLTSYNYCANNPVLFIDPNGKEIWIAGKDGTNPIKYERGMKYDGDDKFISNTITALNYANDDRSNYIINNNIEWEGKVTIQYDVQTQAEIGIGSYVSEGGIKNVLQDEQKIKYGGKGLEELSSGKSFAPFVSLLHELGHISNAIDDINGFVNRRQEKDDNYTNKEEQFNIENNENVIAKKYNMLERKTHKGENYKEIKTDSPISNKKIE